MDVRDNLFYYESLNSYHCSALYNVHFIIIVCTTVRNVIIYRIMGVKPSVNFLTVFYRYL